MKTPDKRSHSITATSWPDRITVGHVIFDHEVPYLLPPIVPSIFFLQPLPAATSPSPSESQSSTGFIDGATVYSAEENNENWYPYLSCGWFPVLVIYPDHQPIPAHAWVHISPMYLPGPPDCIPPPFGTASVSQNHGVYVGRQYVHSLPAMS
jgi:hypothetical protein